MRFMVIVKATKDSENEGALPDPQLMADMNKFNDELLEAGVLLGYDGLHPSSKGARVHFSGKNCTVIDGPFAESKELIASFWFWQVKSLEEAIEWVKRCPNPHAGDFDIDHGCYCQLPGVAAAVGGLQHLYINGANANQTTSQLETGTTRVTALA